MALRKSEMMDCDIALLEAAAKKRRGTQEFDDADDATFHFIAYMPIAGSLWELDGLKRQPVKLSKNPYTGSVFRAN